MRFVMIVVIGLLGGVVVHIAAVLSLPSVGGRDLWLAMEVYGLERTFNLIPAPAPGAESIAYLDPHMAHAVCRIDLSDGPSRILAHLDADFWSLGVLDAQGRSLFSLNSGTPVSRELDVLLIKTPDLTALRRDPPRVLEDSVVIDLGVDMIVIVLRAFAPGPGFVTEMFGQFAEANCDAPFDLSPPDEDGIGLIPPGAAAE